MEGLHFELVLRRNKALLFVLISNVTSNVERKVDRRYHDVRNSYNSRNTKHRLYIKLTLSKRILSSVP